MAPSPFFLNEDNVIRAPSLLSKDSEHQHSTHHQRLSGIIPAQNPSSDEKTDQRKHQQSAFLDITEPNPSSHEEKYHNESALLAIEEKRPNAQALASRLHRVVALAEGKEIHAYIKTLGLEQDSYLANLLISMYHRFDELQNARAVFDNLQYPSVVSWNCIIKAYTKGKHVKEALQLFKQMLQKGHKPNRITFLNILGSCVSPETLAEGKWIHAYVVKEGFKRDISICNSLITMYARCGDLKEAASIFHSMRHRNLVSWNSVIAAYCKHGQGKKVLELFAKMQQQRMQPDQYTFVSMLSMFASPESLAEAKGIHNCIIDHGFHTELIVGNALINMYNKCGAANDAFLVFGQMSERDVISWTSMIDAYSQNGHGRKALQLFQEMQHQGIKPNRATFIIILSACAALEDSEEGKAIHSLLKDHGLPMDVYLGNALIYMYGKCGELKDARAVFDEMHTHDSVSWTIMLHAYASHEYAKEALQLFQEMQRRKMEPDKSHYISALDACGILSALEEGKALHVCVSNRGFQSDIIVGNALICMYSRCGSLTDARTVFESMRQHDVVSWNAMITAYVKEGNIKEAFDCFSSMEEDGVEPNKLTFFGILGACTSSGALAEGKAYHIRIIDCGLDKEVFLGNSLINMYGKCGAVEDALAVFDHMQSPDLASWNSMIAAYCHCGNGKEALRVFRRLQEKHVKPDKVTFLSVVRACTILKAPEICKAIHASIKDCGLESDVVIGGALINMYGKFKALKEAREVFDRMDDHNVVSWTAMIDAYAQHGCYKEAMQLFSLMQLNNFQPNKVTLISLLSSCISPAALEEGKAIHSYIIDKGFESDLFVGNALVSMYGKCRALEYARQAFDRMGQHDVVSWTAMMNVYLRCKQDQSVLQLYEQMQQELEQPNQVTFVSVVNACANLKALADGKAIHASIIDAGYGSDILIKQALTNMYRKCDAFEELYSLTT